MKIPYIASLLLALTGGLAFGASNVVTVDGKTYQIKFDQPELKNCPVDSPTYSAFIFLYNFAYGNGYNTMYSACVATCYQQTGNIEQCKNVTCVTSDRVVEYKKSANESVFALMREYPPSYRNEFCKKARDFCTEKCIATGVLDKDRCRVDCEQYETYNKQ